MAVLTVFGESYSCARAQKGDNFVRLLDENNTIIFFADEISDFSPYVLSEGSWETPIAVIAPTVAAIASLDGTVVVLDVPATVKVETDLVVNFRVPCDCSIVSALSINGKQYTVVNALGECITGTGTVWSAGAQLSVILDVEEHKAYLQNGAAATPADLKAVEDAMAALITKALFLNFNVFDGTSTPANPAKNDIWVNTNTPMSGWVFTSTEPADPSEGMIWFMDGGKASVILEKVTTGNITIYPLSAKQYIGGAWVTKEAKSYQNGEWKEWLTLLIDGADECVDVTGGWESLAVNIATSSTGGKVLNVTHGADYIELTGNAGYGGMYATKNKISCNGNTSLRITGEINAFNQRVSIAALSSLTSSGVVTEWTSPVNSDLTLYTFNDEPILDLPKGEYYIAFGMFSSDNQYIRLNKVSVK